MHRQTRLPMMRLLAFVGLLMAVLGTASWARAVEPAQIAPAYYAPAQVIVSGLRDQVTAVTTAVGGSAGLVLIARTDLSYTSGLPGAAPFPFPLPPPSGNGPLVMDLYRILSPTSVPQMVVALNREAIDQGVDVFADPNYATGRPPALIEGDPWSGSGSPVAGSASTPAPALFWQQWAFRARGIELLSEGQPPQRLVPFDGQGVRVAIFDTSPFGPQIGIKETLQQVSWITPTLNLTVTHPAPAYTWEPPAPATDVRGHGLFVAGLAHAVAPQSDISLTRVLDQYGQGDLYTLSRELHRFISDTVVLDSGDGAVINLSLGVHPPPNAAMLGLPAEIVSLETAILSASGFDIVVVGAAGNDGDTSAAQLPASYPTVIGLAASSAQRGRGCFSNLGDVAAPGGNGSMPGCTPEPTSSTALISLAPIVEKTDTGYAYWMGTSFAAPLASGTAALLLDAHNGALSPAQVAARIYQGAQPPDLPPEDESLGAGIISLKRTLLPFNIHLPLAASGP